MSAGEVGDALRAVAAVGVERERLRDALAMTLVKDEADRGTFEPIFERHFPLVAAPERRAPRKRRKGGGGSEAGPRRGAGGEGEGVGGRRVGTASDRGEVASLRLWGPEAGRRLGGRGGLGEALRKRNLEELDAEDRRDATLVAEALGRSIEGRVRRRVTTARRGRIDLRRTARHALQSGGVPLVLRHRGRRLARPDLVALCDVSGSVAAASDCLLALLAAMPSAFRRSELFAFVDRLVPVSVERGHVAPEGTLDLHARSDFGRVLGDLVESRVPIDRETVVLILGDARNNRRPPRADLLRAVAARAGRVVWLVPEAPARWNQGDSALAAYASSCHVLLECRTLEALAEAVRRHVL